MELQRINENMEALQFDLEKEDYDKLNTFRAKEFDTIKIDWEGKGGVTIDQLANQFE